MGKQSLVKQTVNKQQQQQIITSTDNVELTVNEYTYTTDWFIAYKISYYTSKKVNIKGKCEYSEIQKASCIQYLKTHG